MCPGGGGSSRLVLEWRKMAKCLFLRPAHLPTSRLEASMPMSRRSSICSFFPHHRFLFFGLTLMHNLDGDRLIHSDFLGHLRFQPRTSGFASLSQTISPPPPKQGCHPPGLLEDITLEGANLPTLPTHTPTPFPFPGASSYHLLAIFAFPSSRTTAIPMGILTLYLCLGAVLKTDLLFKSSPRRPFIAPKTRASPRPLKSRGRNARHSKRSPSFKVRDLIQLLWGSGKASFYCACPLTVLAAWHWGDLLVCF